MKNLLIIIILLSFLPAIGQRATYKLDPLHTKRKVKKTSVDPEIYTTISRQTNLIKKGSKTTTINPEYVEIEEQIAELNEQLINENASLEQIDTSDYFEEIKNLITSFFDSKEDEFDLKKEFLINAQNLAYENNFDVLIYSDSTINSENQAKYQMLKISALDLKIHLNRVVWEIDEMKRPGPVVVDNSASLQLEQEIVVLEEKLATLDKSKTKTIKDVETNRMGLYLGSKSKVSNLEGDFVELGRYYLVTKDYKNIYKKGEIVKEKDIEKDKLKNTGFVGNVKVLIKNKNGNTIHLTQTNFLKNYAFSINGKYNVKSNDVVSK